MKKLIAILLAVVLVFALASVAFAADAEETAAADVLYALGLFKGTGTDGEGKPVYDLDRAPNRMEAVTMLVRLLGKEEEANAGTWVIPFTDVADWAKPYVGYAYANGLTKGTGDTTFSGTDPVTATQYLTFALRALGYSSAEDGDFKWDAAWELTDRLNITKGEYGANTPFDRGDVVKISYAALGAYLKGEGRFLGEKLLDEGVFTLEQYHAAMSGGSGEEDGQNPVMNFVGTYVYGRASATVSCEGTDSARIEITWSSSYAERAVWEIVGKLDPETLTVSYTGAIKKNQISDENGLKSEETIYADGTGTIVFNKDGTFTWHEDQSEYDEDFTFEWVEIVKPEEDGQNPVMNFVGEYQSDRASAMVECGEGSSAIIHIHWGGSAWDSAEWVIVGELDTETLTISYTGAIKTFVTRNDQGIIEKEEVAYEDGTGTIVFNEDGTFTWHEDQSEYGQDMVFEFLPAQGDEEDGQNPVMNFIGIYTAGRPHAQVECFGKDSAIITIHWSDSLAVHAEWLIIGRLDPETLTINYTDCTKKIVTFDDPDADEPSSVVTEYANGTGTITFTQDNTFIWHDNQSPDGEDLVFKWALTD
ncbi:MAG: S-layer homology domain-containing protein [Oscillospiraceae bacterium]|nr:S-layer homology domain-containing protein [Oscillospiraceae bacterium]